MQTPGPPANFACAQGHERRHLLVADLDELRVAVGAAEGADEPLMPSPG
jgi:hypothetical protein